MTVLENRPNAALLVVDVQNGVVAGAHERAAVVANVGRLVDPARVTRAGIDRLGRESRCMDEPLLRSDEEVAAVRLAPPEILDGPIDLVEYDPAWPSLYADAKSTIVEKILDRAVEPGSSTPDI